MKTKCPKCGLELLEGEKVCPQCGFSEHRKPYRLFQLIVSILILVILLTVYLSQFFGNITYRIPSELSEKMFGKSAEEFCQTDGEGTIFYENIISSNVDDMGNLVIKLSDDKNERIKEECVSKIAQTKDQLAYSSDCTEISVYVYQETFFEKSTTLATNLRFFAFYQLLNGTEPENVNVNYKIIDLGTGEELVNINWPQSFDDDQEAKIDESTITSREDLNRR